PFDVPTRNLYFFISSPSGSSAIHLRLIFESSSLFNIFPSTGDNKFTMGARLKNPISADFRYISSPERPPATRTLPSAISVTPEFLRLKLVSSPELHRSALG